MNYKIIIKSTAEQEIREAKAWYDSENLELGKSFIESVDEVIDKISVNPKTVCIKI